MPVGRFDQPVRWGLLNGNETFARSVVLSVARKSLAAATVFAVTAGCGGCWIKPSVIEVTSVEDKNRIREICMRQC
jgi:hypothetical protein